MKAQPRFHHLVNVKSLLTGIMLLGSLTSPAWPQEDPRVKALNDFLWSRTQANDVTELAYMTDSLKDWYRHNKRMKIRSESGRLLSFSFDPRALDVKDNGKKFEAAIVGTWVNLNGHLIGEVDEHDTFVETPQGWRADKLKFGKERPTDRTVVEGFEATKEYRDALKVVKIVLRAWADRDFATAESHLSPDFERTFRSRDEVHQIFQGTSNPHHVAYAIRRIIRADRGDVGFVVDLYEMTTGDPRLNASRVQIEVKRYDSGWFVNDWSPLKEAGSAS